jgi:hypothetical protein
MFLCRLQLHGSKRGSEASLGNVPFETCSPEGVNHYGPLLRSIEWIRESGSEFDNTNGRWTGVRTQDMFTLLD